MDTQETLYIKTAIYVPLDMPVDDEGDKMNNNRKFILFNPLLKNARATVIKIIFHCSKDILQKQGTVSVSTF